MKSDENQSELTVQYQALLKLLASTLKYLEGINVDPSLLKSYRQLLRHLRTRPARSISEILGNARGGPETAEEKYERPLSDEEILGLTAKEIVDRALNSKVSRKDLEKIAAVRFGVTRGALSTLRSRDALVEKLRTLIDNEGTHDSIARVAGKPWSDR